jgi:hypothetical protein
MDGMNADETKKGLEVCVIWIDDDLIELACKVAYGRYSGESVCYTNSPQLHDFADALTDFCLKAEGEPRFHSGFADGSNACDLHAYTLDRARHMAVHVRMATDQLTLRPQSISRLELEMLVEAWSLSQFAEQLRYMARTKTGEAFLAVPDAASQPR